MSLPTKRNLTVSTDTIFERSAGATRLPYSSSIASIPILYSVLVLYRYQVLYLYSSTSTVYCTGRPVPVCTARFYSTEIRSINISCLCFNIGPRSDPCPIHHTGTCTGTHSTEYSYQILLVLYPVAAIVRVPCFFSFTGTGMTRW